MRYVAASVVTDTHIHTQNDYVTLMYAPRVKNNRLPAWFDDKSGDGKQVYYKSWYYEGVVCTHAKKKIGHIQFIKTTPIFIAQQATPITT